MKGIWSISKVMTSVITVMAAAGMFVTAAHATDGGKYRAMIEETGSYLTDALVQYKKGNVAGAKAKAQAAYFEVYENLEGPIRVNVSAKKNIELEEEFVSIRKMIIGKASPDAIEKEITSFMTRLRAIAPELEGGVELVAESGKEGKQAQGDGRQSGKNIEAAWREAYGNIEKGLKNALDIYKKGGPQKGAEAVVQTQFDHYKNSLLSTAVKRYVSQKKDFANNSAFSDLAEEMRKGTPAGEVEGHISAFLKEIDADLPALAQIDGATASGQEAEKPAQTGAADKDWSKVTAELLQQVEKAIALYKSGETKNAVASMQDAYFDTFEASGMEAKIGARDAGFKARLEGHFTMMVGRMKAGEPAQKIEGMLASMKSDFAKGTEMLGKGKDSPTALFFYSLMVILREGIEAILIITAIIAYMIKTGNTDRLKVIYNACITALVMSLVTAVLVRWVFRASAASQEMMEGWTMLIASVVLFSCSYWLISKAEAQKWMSYIKDKVGDSISSKSLRALWFAAFLAVFREGAETVLFYQALAADSNASGITAVAAGFILGSLLLVAIFLGMRYGAMKLPIRPFFLFTGALLYYMSFVFAGKGVMELIEGKLFEPSLISWAPSLPLIGLFPYKQTLAPQFFIFLAAIAAVVILLRQRAAASSGTK